VIAAAASTNQGQAKGIDKSILTVAAPRRYPTGSTFAVSCNSRASSVAASHPIPRYMQPRDVGVAPGCQRWLGPRLD
jgi:hypothetical protein